MTLNTYWMRVAQLKKFSLPATTLHWMILEFEMLPDTNFRLGAYTRFHDDKAEPACTLTSVQTFTKWLPLLTVPTCTQCKRLWEDMLWKNAK